ncbi:MAG: MFS transporter [Phycisphaerales bacterium]|nr:MFS transporter [Phycisphaerales bacterium]
MTDASTDGAVSQAIKNYFRAFGALKSCGREFWGVQLVNLLDGAAYFAMLTVSTLYLSETLGYSDANAANLWAACMTMYTLTGCIAGFVGDSIGIRRTLYLSIGLLIVSRLAISFTTAKPIVVPALFLIAIGTAIMTPILISATKRYTSKESQTAGFSMLYLLMNIGAFVGNATLDPLRGLPWGNRSIFMMGSAMSIGCWLAVMFAWRRRIDQADSRSRHAKNSGVGTDQSGKWEAPWTIASSVFRESAFWRFMLFLFLLVGVRLVFEHQSQIYPKYYQRTIADYVFGLSPQAEDGDLAQTQKQLDNHEISPRLRQAFGANDLMLSAEARAEISEAGSRWKIDDGKKTFYVRLDGDQLSVYSSDAPIGLLNSINPFIICFGVIISTPIVARFKLFNVLVVGITISAISMLFLVIHPGWFCSALGLSLSQGYAVIVVLQIMVFSIGEAIWSPRLYEYTAAIAPVGREASYMGLSYLPTILARSVEGPIAGQLLNRYCPPDIGARLDTVPYSQSPQFMCLILAVLAMGSPILVVVFRKVIQKEASRAV